VDFPVIVSPGQGESSVTFHFTQTGLLSDLWYRIGFIKQLAYLRWKLPTVPMADVEQSFTPSEAGQYRRVLPGA
jgi:hypothetical protein